MGKAKRLSQIEKEIEALIEEGEALANETGQEFSVMDETFYPGSKIKEMCDEDSDNYMYLDDWYAEEYAESSLVQGFVRFLEGFHVYLVTKCSVVAVMGGHSIYRIDETRLLPVGNLPPALTAGTMNSTSSRDRSAHEKRYLWSVAFLFIPTIVPSDTLTSSPRSI